MTNQRIDVDGLVAAVNQFQKELMESTHADLEATCKEVGDTIKQELQNTSPKQTGKYSRGWKVTLDSGSGFARALVHDTQYQLVHLLEYGHALKSGGRTKPQPHVAPAQDKADSLFIEKLQAKIGASR